jgi:large subunit ribosomal protein L18
MSQQKLIMVRRQRRKFRVRNKVSGTPERPRLSVHRSSKHIYAQLIDDVSGTTLAAATSSGKEMSKELKSGANITAAKTVGKKLAEAAKAKGITVAAFDRGHYRFHGRVMALAQAATAAGLKCSGDPKPPKAAPPPAEAKPEGKKKDGKPKPDAKEKPEAKEKGGDKPAKADKPAKTEKKEPK